MRVLYLAAIWIHILTIAIWIGAMFFQDPHSKRLPSRMVEKMNGVGWYAQAVVWSTGLFMLNYRGISPRELFSAEFIASSWGRALWAKLSLVIVLAIFQATVARKGLLYWYLLVIFTVVGLSVLIVRPILL
jgi:hypothetical protein